MSTAATATAPISAIPRANLPSTLFNGRSSGLMGWPKTTPADPESDVDGAAAAAAADAEVASVAVGPADVDGAAVVRTGLVSAAAGAPPRRGAPAPDEPGAPGACGAPAAGADVRGGAAGAWLVGFGAGFVVGLGAGGGGAGAAGGAITGCRAAPKAQPSTVPGLGSYPPAPTVL